MGIQYVEEYPGQAGEGLWTGSTKFEKWRAKGVGKWEYFRGEEEWELAKWMMKNIGQNAANEFLNLKVRTIINAVTAAAAAETTPFLWGFFTRPEPHIVFAFSRPKAFSVTWHLTLPAQSPNVDEDIRSYLVDGLQMIKRKAPENSISLLWPSQHSITQLVEKSDGLFIYATNAVRFIDKGSVLAGPEERLQALVDPVEGSRTGFSNLDQLYLLLMDQIPRDILPDTLLILYANQYLNSSDSKYTLPWHTIPILSSLLGFSLFAFRAAISPLASVLHVTSNDVDSHPSVQVYHTSFTDFLNDIERSTHEYCIHTDRVCTSFYSSCLQALSRPLIPSPTDEPYMAFMDGFEDDQEKEIIIHQAAMRALILLPGNLASFTFKDHPEFLQQLSSINWNNEAKCYLATFPRQEVLRFAKQLPSNSRRRIINAHSTNVIQKAIFTIAGLRLGKSFVLGRGSKKALLNLSAGVFIPTVPQIVKDLNSTEEIINSGVGLFFFANAIGSLAGSRYSSFYGRRPIYLWWLPVMIFGSVGVANASDVPSLMFWRFFQALGSAPGSSVGAGVIGDIYKLEERGKAIGIFVCPLLSEVLLRITCLGERCMLSLPHSPFFGFVSILIFFPETIHPGTKGIDHYVQSGKTPSRWFPVMLNPIAQLSLLRSPNIFASSFIIYTGMLTDFALMVPLPYILAERYGIENEALAGLCFLPLGIGKAVGAPIAGRISDIMVVKYKQKRGYWYPEDRLRAAIFGFYLPLNVICFALITKYVPGMLGLVLLLLCLFLNGVGCDMTLTPTRTYVVDVLHSKSAEATAAVRYAPIIEFYSS
ncbi:hypothetical protein NP233_g9768 [Leucocoprinus birnbaumii]|uniref:Major facilitator superfamily (MFS) profile domain-containing protein n=1 Tax=Leucocoprinus birnbaumii TaxID=56174 RepID=A0AAD5VNC6_9AGAR|nr:hypothetical protein NP233_g9768 [Leucocoprinus birnbaumii]